jgi:uncharacterized protein
MTTRATAPVGAPCWADVWTSDVDACARFYGELLGWEAQPPDPEFGGYFMFHRQGVPVAGGMGDMSDMKAQNVWKVYLSTPDMAQTVAALEKGGAVLAFPPMAVGEAGTQCVFTDPTGATLGAWQPGAFHGFSVLGEPGAPAYFELLTRDFDRAVDFYRDAFAWETQPLPGDQGFRYLNQVEPGTGAPLAGVMDAAGVLPPGVPSHWSVYWDVEDTEAAATKVTALGGTVLRAPEASPYGVLATVADPQGAQFKLHSMPR